MCAMELELNVSYAGAGLELHVSRGVWLLTLLRLRGRRLPGWESPLRLPRVHHEEAGGRTAGKARTEMTEVLREVLREVLPVIEVEASASRQSKL